MNQNFEWFQNDENIENNKECIQVCNVCDHLQASFISFSTDQKHDETINNPYMAVEFSTNLQNIFLAIKDNNLERVKKIVQQHKIRCNNLGGGPDFKWDIINDLSFNWSPFHHSIYYGCEKIFLWFLNKGGDLQSITYDGYSCLILGVLSKSEKMVSLLIAQKNLNINHVSKKGAALHIAVQENLLQILKLLLKHPNINIDIYNPNCQRSLDLANGKAKDLLLEAIEEKENTRRQTISQSFIETIRMQQNTFIINSPQRAPIFTGIVKKIHRSKLFIYERYIIIDAQNGLLVRYESKSQAPFNPIEIISLIDINNITIKKSKQLQNDNNFYLQINYFEKSINFLFNSEESIKKLYDALKISIGYARYLKNKFDQYHFNKDEEKEYNLINQLMMENANKEINFENYIPNLSNDLLSSVNTNFENNENRAFQLQNIQFSYFQILNIIGRGSFGFIIKVKYVSLNKIMVLKQQNKEQLKFNQQIDYALNEIKIMKQLKNEFIINILGSFQTQTNLYYVMDYFEKGDLSQYMGNGISLKESDAKFIIAQIILAIEYLHKNNIIHRDIKPLNILIGNDGYILLADLGLSKKLQFNETFSFVGSPAYLAPETIKGSGINKAVDIYGIGVLLYEMLTGYSPHYTQNIEDLIYRIQNLSISFKNIKSLHAKTILKQMLQKDPIKRPTIDELKQHIYFSEINWDNLQNKKLILPPLIKVHQSKASNFHFQEGILVDIDYNNNDDKIEKLNYIKGWNEDQ